MTREKFEKEAKKAVLDALETAEGIGAEDIEIGAEDLETVWFAHVLGFKKCLLYCPEMPNSYFEVTYNRDRDQMYVDIYKKGKNIVFVNVALTDSSSHR